MSGAQKFAYVISKYDSDNVYGDRRQDHVLRVAYNRKDADDYVQRMRSAHSHACKVAEQIQELTSQHPVYQLPYPDTSYPDRPRGPAVHNDALYAEFRVRKELWMQEVAVIKSAHEEECERWYEARRVVFRQALVGLGVTPEDCTWLGIDDSSTYVPYVTQWRYVVDAIPLVEQEV